MAVVTFVHIYSRDQQGYTERVTVEVTPAAFGATTLPTAAHIEALIDAIFGTTGGADGVSTNIVYAYSVEVVQDAPATVGSRDGLVATSIALKGRSGIGVAGRTGRFGQEGVELRLPGFDKGSVTYNPQDRNQANMAAVIFDPIRSALETLGYRDPLTGYVFGLVEILETGVVFNGKRQPMRPR